jgi:hypothetical protein
MKMNTIDEIGGGEAGEPCIAESGGDGRAWWRMRPVSMAAEETSVERRLTERRRGDRTAGTLEFLG